MKIVQATLIAIVFVFVYLILPTGDMSKKNVAINYKNISSKSRSYSKTKSEEFIDEYTQIGYDSDAWLFPIAKGDGSTVVNMMMLSNVGYTKWRTSYHQGSDFQTKPKGENNQKNIAIVNAKAGVVKRSGFQDNQGTGLGGFVEVVTDDGMLMTYMHMIDSGANYVKAGEKVEQGTLFGYMGNTGRSDGKHLHLQVAIPVTDGDGTMQNVNPYTLAPINPNSNEEYLGPFVKYFFDDSVTSAYLAKKPGSSQLHTVANPSLLEENIVPNPISGHMPEIEEPIL